MLISQQFSSIASKIPGAPALRYLGKDINYSELKRMIARLSYLYQNEIGTQPRVAFIARNSPAFVVTFFAMSNIRAVSIPMDPETSDEDLAHWLKESRATHIAVTSDLVTRVRELQMTFRLSLPLIEIEKKQGGEYDVSFTTPPDQQPQEGDVILLLRSAGISGKYHFASFTHKQLVYAASSLKTAYHMGATDRFFTSLSWAHPFAFSHAFLGPLLNGTTSVIDHGMEPSAFLNFLVESRVNRILGTPPHFQRIQHVCKNENRQLTNIRSLTIMGGALSPELARFFKDMKVALAHCYGQVENLWTIALGETHFKESTDGAYFEPTSPPMLPLSGMKYKVVDEQGDELEGSDSRVGQLAMSGPTIMTRYDGVDKALEMETKTAIRGTWLYTGDIMRMDGQDESLQITFLGRKKDLLIIKHDADAEYIIMNEVTRAVLEVPGVQDAAGFVVKSSRDDLVIAAAVVKIAGSAVSDKFILDYLKKSLFDDQMPKVVAFTDFIPKDVGGNPNYAKLRSQFSGIVG